MAEPAVGQVVDGRYQLEELIGRGGMGQVFRARHVFTHQQVALKLITDGLDTNAMQQFLTEARAASTIGHPAIVEVSDANRTPEGELYLVMELLVGKPLRVAMTRGISPDDIKRIGLELLDALAAAHARGVIHRDLKPENIYLVAPSGALKVLDFGIAKVLGAGSSAHGRVLGTLEYMAPEQLADSTEVDGRADLWSVGVMLYEMIAGVRPYAGTTRADKFEALANDEPIPITSVARVAPDVAAFFATVLVRDPARRFQNAQQMAAALRWLTLAGERMASEVATTPIVPPTPIEPRARSSSAPPGPTLGTGEAWIRPVSQPPEDGVVGAPRSPPGSIPPPDGHATTVPQPPPGYVHRAPPAARRRRNRKLALGVLAVAVIGGAIAIGAVAGSRSSASSGPVPERCEAACKGLGDCGIALKTCVNDCKAKPESLDCLESATDCPERSQCMWQTLCNAPAAGQSGCGEALDCLAQCKPDDRGCQCNCNQALRPASAGLMARLYTCSKNHPENDIAFVKQCNPITMDCIMDRTGKVVGPSHTLTDSTATPTHTVDRSTCEALCASLKPCELALPSCTSDCQAGQLDTACLGSASTCGEKANCYWQKVCKRPLVPGDRDCNAGLNCWAMDATKPAEWLCQHCYDKLSPKGSVDLARSLACNKWMNDEVAKMRPPDSDKIKDLAYQCLRPNMQCTGSVPSPE